MNKEELRKLGQMAKFAEPDIEVAQSKGICVKCGEAAKERCHTVAGLREYEISGLCEICFDGLFPPEEN